MTRLLMIGCGWMGRPYLARAHARGLEVAILDSAAAFSWPETQAALGRRDRCYVVEGTDTEAYLAAAAAALADGPVDAVVGFSEPHVVAAALVAEELGLPGPGLRAAVTSRNKALQRGLFARHGIAQPAHLLARGADSALRWAADRFPVVAKPLANSGSLGVEIIPDAGALGRWIRDRGDGPFLVEHFLAGPEYSVEAVIQSGRVVFASTTAKVTTEPPYCVELEHWIPGLDEPASVRAALGVLDQVVDALAMGSGLVHLELKLEPTGWHVVEVAVRTPGDYLTDGVQAATGVDLYDSALAVALGAAPRVERTASERVCIWFPTAAPGPIADITGSDAMSALPGVVNAEIDYEPGGEVHPLRSSMDRLGVVIVSGATDAELRARVAHSRDAFRVSTRTPTPA